MKGRTTQVLLAVVAVLLAVHWLRADSDGETGMVPEVIRAHAFELLDADGKVVAQMYVGQDGGGNIRLRSGDGVVRVKIGGTDSGSGLILMDTHAEPAISLSVNASGTSITLAAEDKGSRVLKP